MGPNPKPPLTLNTHILGILERCSSIIHLKQLQAYLLTLGHAETQFFSFKLVRFCTLVLADLRYARLIFDSLDSPNVYLYTAMITAYSSQFDSAPALHLFNQMLRRGRPKANQFIYPHVLKSCSDAASINTTRSVTAHIVKTGFEGHWVVHNSLLDAYAKCSDLDTALRLFDELPEKNVVSWTAMVTGYARVGMVRKAALLFEEMPDKDVPSWNAILAGFSQNGLFSEAITLFQQMVLVGVLPNQRTVVSVLSACGHLGMLQLGRWVHGYACKNNIGSSPFVANGLVDMYGKCGSLKQAKLVFDASTNKSLTSWNSMINCLALHGQSDDAIVTFERMEMEGSPPDEITFVGVLNACVHGGLVAEGRGYFESMTSDYGIEPRIEHYGCMIDLYGRAGKFEEVIEVIKDMRIEPDEVVWGSLLNACRIHGDAKLAEFAVRKLLEIYPNRVDYGVMLANLYSECGKWEEVGRVRKSLKETGGKKLPGCSWIELESKVHQFYSGDKKHPGSEEIYRILEGFVGLTEL